MAKDTAAWAQGHGCTLMKETPTKLIVTGSLGNINSYIESKGLTLVEPYAEEGTKSKKTKKEESDDEEETPKKKKAKPKTV